MQLIQLLQIANGGYVKDFPESPLLDLVNKKTGQPLKRQPGGDSLALFVVIELAETYDEEATDDEQLEEAVRVMTAARDNLENIIVALEKRQSV